MAVVEDLESAAELIRAQPGLTAVTRAGDVFTAFTVRGGSANAPSLLEVQAAVDDAEARLAGVSADLERNRFALASAQARRAEAQERADTALDRLHESDARLAAVAERLGHLNSVLRSAVGESERLGASLAKAEANIVAEQDALQAAAARLDAAQRAPEDEEPSPELRDELAPCGVSGEVGRNGGQAVPAKCRGATDGHPQPGPVPGTGGGGRAPGT